MTCHYLPRPTVYVLAAQSWWCTFYLFGKWKSHSRVQLFATPWTIYTVHGILQARILEWVAFPFSRGTSQPHNQTRASCIAGGFFTNWAIRELKKEEKERKRRGRRIQKGEFCRPWHEILYLRQDSLFDVFQATLPAFICAVPAPLCHSDSLKPV